MVDTYDVQHFELDYCRQDVTKIAAAIKRKASLPVIGMPGCGKSRLIDFMLHRPGVLEQYGLADQVRFVWVDGDLVTTGPPGLAAELLRALGAEVPSFGGSSLDELKNRLMTSVGQLDPATDLVVIVDNFVASLQQQLGENFFNFLFALRNSRPRLNLAYIFIANLQIDLAGFFKLERLFDQGVAQSICWVSLLSEKDNLFSIDRQLYKAGCASEAVSSTHKRRIFELSGGHPLLTRYLTHLMLNNVISLTTSPAQILDHSGIKAACEAIWHDLDPGQRHYLLTLAQSRSQVPGADSTTKLLQNYGLLTPQSRFFSSLFARFVQAQEQPRTIIDVRCDETQTRLFVRTVEEELSFLLQALSRRKRKLLSYLVENQGELCAKDHLIKIGWPADESAGVSDRALSRQIDGLRLWLEEQVQLSRYVEIEAVWGEGYQLVIKD